MLVRGSSADFAQLWTWKLGMQQILWEKSRLLLLEELEEKRAD